MARTKTTELGDVFGKLTVTNLYRVKRENGESWRYMCTLTCTCGGARDVERGNLHKSSFNFECLECSGNAGGKLTHGHSIARKDVDPIGYNCYTRWQSIKRRCYKEYDSHYKHYGARGIKMCDRWLNSYKNFLCDMGLPPTKYHQIDRIDNNGDYEPSNCRWVERNVNARNKRSNRMITANGETMTLVEWSERTGLKRECIAARLKRGWSSEKALGITN